MGVCGLVLILTVLTVILFLKTKGAFGPKTLPGGWDRDGLRKQKENNKRREETEFIRTHGKFYE